MRLFVHLCKPSCVHSHLTVGWYGQTNNIQKTQILQVEDLLTIFPKDMHRKLELDVPRHTDFYIQCTSIKIAKNASFRCISCL